MYYLFGSSQFRCWRDCWNNAKSLISDILPNNIRLSAKCVWSGASVARATITVIIHYSEKIVLKSSDGAFPIQNFKRDAYISLLELGTPYSLKAYDRFARH